MPKWVRVAAVTEIPSDRGLEVVAGGHVLALYKLNDSVRALDGICPHAGGPLAKGRVVDGIVTCPWHGWQFHVDSGKHCLNANLHQPVFPTKIEGPDVYVEIQDE